MKTSTLIPLLTTLVLAAGCTKTITLQKTRTVPVRQEKTAQYRAIVERSQAQPATTPTAARHAVTADIVEARLIREGKLDVRRAGASFEPDGAPPNAEIPTLVFIANVGVPAGADVAPPASPQPPQVGFDVPHVFTVSAQGSDGRILATRQAEGPWPAVVDAGMSALLSAEALRETDVTYHEVTQKTETYTAEKTVDDDAGTTLVYVAAGLAVGLALWVVAID